MIRLPEKAPVPPLRCLRRFCLECQGGSSRSVRECADLACCLRPWRLSHTGTSTGAEGRAEIKEALRSIRKYCLICAGSRPDVRLCEASACPLWHFRFGVTPATYHKVMRRFFAPKALLLPGLEHLAEKKTPPLRRGSLTARRSRSA